ncbi:hypothetical protein A7979_09135 [Rothia nasimurium]|uniref:Uncharacterized protein n=1 Tax=Rothia nasimurium TaxID=85336 RepID=A0A1Y1RTH0_9MICC|nr:hypothetical protein [Rothia nasimurium]ORC24986.1 hypothetical protein A7979_09135 [Rothia nasimurium]
MPSVHELVAAAGRAGWGSEGAAAASAEAMALAARIREWSDAVASQVRVQAEQVVSASRDAWVAGQVDWLSQAGQAFGRALSVEREAGALLGRELEDAAGQVRVAGEVVAAQVEVLAAAIGAAGAAVDAVLVGMGSLDVELDDFVVYAERAGLPQAHAQLTAVMSDPLMGRVAAALAEVGR